MPLPPPDLARHQQSVPPGAPTTQPGRGRNGMAIGAALVGAAVAISAVAVTLALNLERPAAPTTTPTPTPSPSPSASSTPSASPVRNQIAKTPRLGLEVWQGGAASPMSLGDQEDPVTTVAMKAEPFELRVPSLGKDLAMRICAWTDESVFRIEAGAKTESHPCYSPGTGIADFEHGSGTLFLNQEGHNYLIDTRLAKHSEEQDKILVSQFGTAGASTSVDQWKGDVYLSVFIDKDGDDTFDRTGPAEFEYVILDFPE